MTTDPQPFPYLHMAVGATLTPPGAAPVAPSKTYPVVAPPPTPEDEDDSVGPGSDWHTPRLEDTAGHRSLRTRLVAVDCAAVLVGWIVLAGVLDRVPGTLARLAPGLAAAVVTLVAMRSLGLYRARLCTRKVEELGRLVLSSLWGTAVFVVVQYEVATPGAEALACATAAIAALAIGRWQYGRWLRAQRARGRYLRRVLLVGSNEDAVQLETMLRSEPELGYVVTGVIGGQTDAPVWRSLPASRSVNGIPRLAASTGAVGVLVVPYALSSAATERAIDVATETNLHVQVWPGLRGIGSRRLRSVPVSGEPFFYVEPRAAVRWQLAAKRVIDVIGAGLVLLLTAPVIGVAALLIKLDDGGPVFHRGERVGLGGKTFLVYKLRSMRPNQGVHAPDLAALNERVDGPLFKASNDPRVTRVGRLLRASSIDELPQLWNVLEGTMSLVGPRPALPHEAEQFDDELQRRHSVRPGITGLWQVEARHNPSFNAYRRLDLRYVDTWSLWLDLGILVSTVPSVASQAVGMLRRRH